MNYTLEYLERIMHDGLVGVDCSADCGNYATVEPDGDYPCGCGNGRLTSPLILEGLI